MFSYLLANGLADAQEKAAKATEAVTQIATNVAGATNEATQATQQGGNSVMFMILYIVGLGLLFYFFVIRPQKKREKELHSMQDSIKVGDWVMTSSGFYGKVADITDQVFVVEFGTNKGVKIPVKKSEIFGNKEPNLSNKPSETEENK